MNPLRCALTLVFAVVAVHCFSSISGNQVENSAAGFSSAYASDETFPTSPYEDSSDLLLTNLTARAQAVVLSKRKPVLTLNVTWEHTSDDQKRPGSYNIIVHSLARPEEKYCQPFKFAEKYAIAASTTSYLMPQMLDPPEKGAFKIKAGCSYNVTLFSDEHLEESGTTINYTVPDCVGWICDCKLFMDIPKPEVVSARRLADNRLNVTWSYPAPDRAVGAVVNITDFNIALIISENGRHFFGHTPIRKTKYDVGNDRKSTVYNQEVPLDFPLIPEMFYKIEVTVEDEKRDCHGFPGSKGLEVPRTSTEATSSELLVTVLPSVTFVLACCLAIAMVWQRCGGWIRRKFFDRNIQPIQWQGIYKAVGHEVPRARPKFPYMQQSVIYVEKEIEDAKARGDADTHEVSYTRLELGREIGKGAFGRVFLARADCIAGIPGFMTVAVKKLKQKAKNDEVEEFLSEIAMLKQVGRHPNIVTLLGCVTIKPPYCMVMEYIPCGDLLQYLRQLRVEYERRTGSSLPFITTRSRPQRGPRYVDLALSSDSEGSYIQPESRTSATCSARPSITETEWSMLTTDTSLPLTPARHNGEDRPQHLEYILDPKELQNFAVQIARGMEHLERKQITHRDLAARNVLIDENKTLKISDFGLSRSGIYVNTKRKKVPLRWLSVEAIRDNLYSSKSDVWAFAVVLWEIGTLGGFPYPTVADYDLLNFLVDGKRLDKPDNCTDELYSLMHVCWSHAADNRPSFGDLVSHLDSVICRRRVYVDFENLRPDYTFPPTEQVNANTNGETTSPVDEKITPAE